MVLDLAFSREGNRLASSAADRFIKVWDVGSGKHQRSFEGHSGHVLGISWSADSRLLASVGSDQVSKIWDARAGDQKRTITGFKKEVTDTHFVGLTTNLLVIAADPVVQFRRTDNGGNLRSFSGATDYLYASAVSANGKLLAAGGHASTVRIWQDDGKLLVAFE
jgi:WD40 repeat protein